MIIASFLIKTLRFECLYIHKTVDSKGYGLKSVWKSANFKTRTTSLLFINNGLDDIVYFLFYLFEGKYEIDQIIAKMDAVTYAKSVHSFNTIQKPELKKLLNFYKVQKLEFEVKLNSLKVSPENTCEIDKNLEFIKECENCKLVIFHLNESGEAEETCTLGDDIAYKLTRVDLSFTPYKKVIFNYDFSKKYYFSIFGSGATFLSHNLPNAHKRTAFYKKI